MIPLDLFVDFNFDDESLQFFCIFWNDPCIFSCSKLTWHKLSKEGCAMLMIVFGAGCLLLSVLFHAASLLHLGLPLLYALIVPTLFSGWYYSHYALANGIWYALIVLGLISWIVSLARKIAGR